MMTPAPIPTTLATVPRVERPRERMFIHGPAALGDAELLALILGGGHALHRAALLLRRFGGLSGLAAAMPQELAEVPGIGEASATALCASVELARRLERLNLPYDEPLRSSADVERFVRGALRGATQETFLVLGLDVRRRLRLIREVAKGSLTEVQIHPREVFRPLVRAGAHAVILVHNHPSGEVEPSDADLDLTRRLVDVGWIIGIGIVDHLIVSDFRCCSLVDAGLMPRPVLFADVAADRAADRPPRAPRKTPRARWGPRRMISRVMGRDQLWGALFRTRRWRLWYMSRRRGVAKLESLPR